MALSEADILKITARLALLEHVVGAMFRETAIAAGRTADDVAQHAETVKRFGRLCV
jgi:hypothetical protein